MKPGRADTVWVGAGAIVSGAAGFGFTWLLARGTGAAGAGVVLALISWFTLLLNVGKLGMDTTSVREAARIRVGGAGASTSWVLRWTVRPVLILTAVMAVLVAAGSAWIATWIVADSPVALQPLIVACAVCLPAGAYTIVQLGFLRGLGSAKGFVAIEQLAKPSLRIGAAALLLALAITSAAGFMMAWLAPVLLGAAATLLLSLRQVPRQEREPLDVAERSRVRRFSASRSVAQIADIINTSIGTIVLGVAASAAVTGQFATAFRIVLAGQLVFQAVRILLAPSLAALLAAGDAETANDVFDAGSALIVLLAWPLFLICLIAPEWILGLFGSEFTGAGDVLRVLAVSGLFLAIVGNQGSVVLMSGAGSAAMNAILAGTAVNLLITASLAGTVGAMAAAWGWTLAIVVEGVILSLTLRRLGFQPMPARARSAAALTAGTFGIGLLALVLLLPVQPVLAVALAVIGAGAWAVLAARTGRRAFHDMTSS